MPGTTTRRHWPFRSGYFPKLKTCAAAGGIQQAIVSTIAPIEIRWTMAVFLSSEGRERDASAQPTIAAVRDRDLPGSPQAISVPPLASAIAPPIMRFRAATGKVAPASARGHSSQGG